MAEFRAATGTQPAFLAELLEHGVLIGSSVPGLYGRSALFEDIRNRVVELIRRAGEPERHERIAFPPLITRKQLEELGYLTTFPHLAGTVFGFEGESTNAEELVEAPSELALAPAACYPVYPAIAARGPVAGDGVIVELAQGAVFRNEPSGDPARLQYFHQFEIVRIGPPELVVRWREDWRDRALALLQSIGLDADFAVASDPFFGRAGRLLARGQRQQELKFEISVPIAGEEPTAVASFNYHQAHFAEVHGLVGADGEHVHTACLGFGQERVVLALLHTHGLDPSCWPQPVRDVFWGRD